MYRSSTTEAIVLRKVRVGEIHKALTLLTPSLGLLQALAHGAYKIKSRFRTLSEPFSHLRVYLYHDPVRGQHKVTDMESLSLFESIRGSLVRYYTASLWAEVSLKSFGAGESQGRLFHLLLEALSVLESVSEQEAAALSVQFLLRFLTLSGLQPDLGACAGCARPFAPQEAVYLPPRSPSLVCARCAGSGSLALSPGGRRYLEHTLQLPLRETVRVGLEERSVDQLKRLAYRLVQDGLESGLNTLRCGTGIL